MNFWSLFFKGPAQAKRNFKKVDWYDVDSKTRSIFSRPNMTQLEVKSSIMELDSLVGKIMQTAEVDGGNFGERLKSLKKEMPRNLYQELWQAHHKRNELAHEVEAHTAVWEKDQYMGTYKQAIDYMRRVK